ncbi:bidirectional sugar transporter SWEET15-like [Tasmannia lanceolata]|uniref:bidirectional sugar transporter SWEET15-like n=1 Tax=Tasmannia lanceolata TaxID=3420 RepID=UPI0040649A76
MAIFTMHHRWTFIFGLLGNIVSFMVYLAPLPTFYRVYQKKSTEGFQSVPYVVALFSAMLWIYYAFLKTDASLLITINTIGCIIETIYIAMFIAYARRNARILTAKLLLGLNLGVFSLILLFTLLLAKGSNRLKILGWVCATFSVCVFVAPLSIMRLVIRTKSVEYMPFLLSLFLTLSAVMWFGYGMLMKDLYIALPNVLGFIVGVLQMVLYCIYWDTRKVIREQELPEHINNNIVRPGTMGCSEVYPIDVQQNWKEEELGEGGKLHEQTDNNEENMGTQNEIQLTVGEV